MIRSLILWLTLALLAGCTAIPTAGPVEEVPHSAEPGGIDIAPEPPAEGVPPVRLVEGFLQAMAVPEGDYAIARDYLTEEAAAAWGPDGEITIYEGVVAGNAEGAAISGMQVATLDEAGRYTAQDLPYQHDFGLVRVDGQWRIGSPPPGLILSRYLFERYYARLTLYFMSRIGSHVVPDPIYAHETLATPTAVVEGLLGGPPSSLARVVTNALPDGASLGSDGATIDTRGVVTVDLTGLDGDMPDDARRRLGAQLLWSLTSLPRVTGLVITRDDVTFTLPGATAAGVLELAAQQGYQVLSRASTIDLFGVRESVPGRIPGVGGFERWQGVELPAADLAVSLDGSSVALIEERRGDVALGPLTGELSPVRVGLLNLRLPQYSLGSLWVLGDNVGGTPTLAIVDRTGQVAPVSLDLPQGARIHEFAVSPTRARVALVLQVGEERQLGVATVIGAEPATVMNWQRIPALSSSGQAITDITSVAWQSETGIAFTGSVAGLRSVYTVQIDGSHLEDLGSVTGGIAELAAMARLGGGAIAVRTPADIAWRYEARTRWTRLGEGISAIAYGG